MGILLNSKKKNSKGKLKDSKLSPNESLNSISISAIRDGFKVLSKQEVESARSNAYKYIF